MVLHSVTIQHLAATHGGPFTVAMAEAVGVPRSAVDHELRVGRIEAMHPGVYRSAGTPVDRTLADLGAAVRSARVRDAVETAVVARLTTVPRLFAFVDDHGRKGRNGIGALRLALEEWMLSERPPDSELEIAFARVVRREELPQPQYQFWVEVEGKRFRIDAAWPDVGLAVEVDGWESRNTRLAFQNDTDRQNAITLEGWMFIRFTWTDVVRRPGYVARRISQALALLGTESRR
jgi:very-short-patch-repair endonuclease